MQKKYVFVLLSILAPTATYGMSLSKYSLASDLGKRNISEVSQGSVNSNDVQINKKQKISSSDPNDDFLCNDNRLCNYLIDGFSDTDNLMIDNIDKSVKSKFIWPELLYDEELTKLVEKHKAKIIHVQNVLEVPYGVVGTDQNRFSQGASQICTSINNSEIMQPSKQEGFEKLKDKSLEEVKHEITKLIFPKKSKPFAFIISDEFVYGYKKSIADQEEKNGYAYLTKYAKFCISCVCSKEIYTGAISSRSKSRLIRNFNCHINTSIHSGLNIEPLNGYLNNHVIVLKKYDK